MNGGCGPVDRRSARRFSNASWQNDSGLPNRVLDVLDLELYRSRRFGHPLVLVGVPLPAGTQGSDSDLDFISGQIRITDCVWADERQLSFLLPEADREGAEAFLTRLERAVGLV